MKRHSRPGTNMPRMGDYNLLVVFDQIRRARIGISRIEITQATGLSAQTITNLVQKLIDEGLVVEGEGVLKRHHRGRPRTLLLPGTGAGYAVGAHIDPAHLSVVVMDLGAQIVARAVHPMPPTPEQTVALIARESKRLTRDLPADRVLGIGCAAPGPVNIASGMLVDPPILPGWRVIPLQAMLAEATGMRAYLQKDSIAALSAELWHRNRGTDGTTLFVYLGFGVGFALASDGELMVGSTGNAGEIGHVNVGFDGPLCSCGRRGCMGKAIAYDGMVQTALGLGILQRDVDFQDPGDLAAAMDEIAAKARQGDEGALDMFRAAARALARGVVVAADFLDANNVVIGGRNWLRLAPELEAAIAAEFDQFSDVHALHPLAIHGADYGEWVGAAGAASLVFEEEFSPLPTKLTMPASDPAGRTMPSRAGSVSASE